MILNNSISVFVARRRWLKRILRDNLPLIASHKIFNKIDFHFDPRDMRGPSFHFAYDLEKGFNNYEELTKKKLLEQLPPNGVFFDIGANIGMYSVFFLLNREDCQLYSFEPEPNTYKIIKKNLEGLNADHQLFNLAIGEVDEERRIFTSSINDGGHSFSNTSEDKDESKSNIVKIVNLDQLRRDSNIPLPHVVKIDVEGFELEVLKGMKETIIEAKPFLQVESNNHDLGEKSEFWKFLKSLEPHGLKCMDPSDNRNIELSLDELSKIAKQKNERGHLLSDYFYFFTRK